MVNTNFDGAHPPGLILRKFLDSSGLMRKGGPMRSFQGQSPTESRGKRLIHVMIPHCSTSVEMDKAAPHLRGWLRHEGRFGQHVC